MDRPTRRNFLRSASGLAAGVLVPWSLFCHTCSSVGGTQVSMEDPVTTEARRLTYSALDRQFAPGSSSRPGRLSEVLVEEDLKVFALLATQSGPAGRPAGNAEAYRLAVRDYGRFLRDWHARRSHLSERTLV